MLLLLKISLIAGAACCSSGASVPSLLKMSERAQLGMTTAGSTLIGVSDSRGRSEFFNRSESDRRLLQSIFGAVRFLDSWQLGAELSWFVRHRTNYQTSEWSGGLGDTSLHLTYELGSHLWMTGSLLVPSAQNSHESDLRLRTDAGGAGQWAPSLWLRSQRLLEAFDVQTGAGVRYAFGRAFESAQSGRITREGSLGLSSLLGGGYKWRNIPLRTGLTAGFHWDEGRSERNQFQVNRTGARFFWDVMADATIAIPSDLALTISYKDQTILGPTRNAELSRSIALTFSKGWSL